MSGAAERPVTRVLSSVLREALDVSGGRVTLRQVDGGPVVAEVGYQIGTGPTAAAALTVAIRRHRAVA